MHRNPNLDHSRLEPFTLLDCYPTSDHLGLEFSALLRSGGLVSPAEFASMFGEYFLSRCAVVLRCSLYASGPACR